MQMKHRLECVLDLVGLTHTNTLRLQVALSTALILNTG